MADDDRKELLAVELEALGYTYGSALLIPEDPLQVLLHATPFTGEDSSRQFVCADLELGLTPEYPDVPPIIALRNCKGEGCCRHAVQARRRCEQQSHTVF